jgi:hypothetical protein
MARVFERGGRDSCFFYSHLSQQSKVFCAPSGLRVKTLRMREKAKSAQAGNTMCARGRLHALYQTELGIKKTAVPPACRDPGKFHLLGERRVGMPINDVLLGLTALFMASNAKIRDLIFIDRRFK